MPGNLKNVFKTINRRIVELVGQKEQEIARQYAGVLAEIRNLLGEQFDKYEKDGQLTYAEMAKHDRNKKFLKQVNFLLKRNYQELSKVIPELMKEVYGESWERTAWAIETDSKAMLNYSTATSDQILKMVNNPVSGLTLNERLRKNRSQIIYTIQQEVTQGLVKGESYQSMSKRLKKSLEGDATKAMRIARTEGHRAQESGKYDAASHANNNGVVTMKEWNSMEDRRVRRGVADHRQLNETKIPNDELFDDGLSEGPAPGLLPAAASSINCRCFLTYSIKTVEKPKHDGLENMPFEEWKDHRLEKKEKPPNKPIPKPEPKEPEMNDSTREAIRKSHETAKNALQKQVNNNVNANEAQKLIDSLDAGEYKDIYVQVGRGKDFKPMLLEFEHNKKSGIFFKVDGELTDEKRKMVDESMDRLEHAKEYSKNVAIRIKPGKGTSSYNDASDLLVMYTGPYDVAKDDVGKGKGFADVLTHELGHRFHDQFISEKDWKKWKTAANKYYAPDGTIPPDRLERIGPYLAAKLYMGTKKDYYWETFAEFSSVYISGHEEEREILKKNYPEMVKILSNVYDPLLDF